MDMNVIRWKLNELMAQKRIRNKDLALALGITENSVYRLRRTDEMPRLDPERLNGICAVLQCQPGDLLEWTPDDNGDPEAITTYEKPKQDDESVDDTSSNKHQGTSSLLNIVCEAKETPIDATPNVRVSADEKAA